MKMEYSKPVVEIEEFKTYDVITTSTGKVEEGHDKDNCFSLFE